MKKKKFNKSQILRGEKLRNKLLGILMVFICCVTMVPESFAGNPMYNTKIAHEEQDFDGKKMFVDGLPDYTVKSGQDIRVDAYLLAYVSDAGNQKMQWSCCIWRHLNFYLIDSNGTVVFHEKHWTGSDPFSKGFDNEATAKINTKGMATGDYTLKVYYAGDDADLYSCESTSKFTIKP